MSTTYSATGLGQTVVLDPARLHFVGHVGMHFRSTNKHTDWGGPTSGVPKSKLRDIRIAHGEIEYVVSNRSAEPEKTIRRMTPERRPPPQAIASIRAPSQ